MSYATPAAFKQALEARLRAEAAATGRDLARVRQLLVFERFLSRVFTAFGDAVVLKGGVVLELRLAHGRQRTSICERAETPRRCSRSCARRARSTLGIGCDFSFAPMLRSRR